MFYNNKALFSFSTGENGITELFRI